MTPKIRHTENGDIVISKRVSALIILMCTILGVIGTVFVQAITFNQRIDHIETTANAAGNDVILLAPKVEQNKQDIAVMHNELQNINSKLDHISASVDRLQGRP